MGPVAVATGVVSTARRKSGRDGSRSAISEERPDSAPPSTEIGSMPATEIAPESTAPSPQAAFTAALIAGEAASFAGTPQELLQRLTDAPPLPAQGSLPLADRLV